MRPWLRSSGTSAAARFNRIERSGTSATVLLAVPASIPHTSGKAVGVIAGLGIFQAARLR
jgi:hypothetical protein